MTTDEMERMPHKKPDDDMARIVAEFAPQTRMFLTYADTLGEDVFTDEKILKEYHRYRNAYGLALGQHFETYVRDAELPENATEEEKFNAREFFVDNSINLNEDEAVIAYASEKTKGLSQQETDAYAQRIETHFGTLRNQYLQNKNIADQAGDDWVSSLKKNPKNPGRGGI